MDSAAAFNDFNRAHQAAKAYKVNDSFADAEEAGQKDCLELVTCTMAGAESLAAMVHDLRVESTSLNFEKKCDTLEAMAGGGVGGGTREQT